MEPEPCQKSEAERPQDAAFVLQEVRKGAKLTLDWTDGEVDYTAFIDSLEGKLYKKQYGRHWDGNSPSRYEEGEIEEAEIVRRMVVFKATYRLW